MFVNLKFFLDGSGNPVTQLVTTVAPVAVPVTDPSGNPVTGINCTLKYNTVKNNQPYLLQFIVSLYFFIFLL